MRKAATLFLLFIAFSLVFAGAASAQDVQTAVYDENGNLVEDACLGQDVVVEANATTDGCIIDPTVVSLNVDPETGMEFVPEEAVMWFNGIPYENDDPIFGGFFEWNDVVDAWLWSIGFMDQNDFAKLWVPAVVTDVGPITVDAGLWTLEGPFPEGLVLLDTDSYTFVSHPCAAGTVPMQETGAPLALAALGLLGVIGGVVYGRIR